MKNLFPGYYRKTEAELNAMWQNGIIVFDTNVLLNLYRYSDSTKDTILDLITKFSDKIWLPYQAALEYNRNRCEVIAEQEKAYKEFSTKITQIKSDLQSTSKPPFLSSNVDKELNESFKKVSSEVENSIKKYSNYLKEDPIYSQLSELFENKIGVDYNEEKLNQIFKEGDERFKNKVPPGFEDEKTKEGNKKYGDLVLWKQIIDKAIEEKKAIILVTDERKKDWWWNLKDSRLMGPRQELVEEIKKEANVDFHMYSSERFLSYGQHFLKEQVDNKALEEIQAMKEAEVETKIETKNSNPFHKQFTSTFNKKQINKLSEEIFEVECIIDRMNDDISTYFEKNPYDEKNELPLHIKNIIKGRNDLEIELIKLTKEYKNLI